MDTATGEIYKVIDGEVIGEDGARKPLDDVRARFMKLIPDGQLHHLSGMNRKQRREYYRLHKKEFLNIPKSDKGA